MTTNYTPGRERHAWETRLAGLIALTALAAAVLLAISLAPASAETPAERCKRETTAYNNAWKNSWAAAHPGKKPSDAPKPPVPYKCGGNNQAPPSLPPSTTPEQAPDGKTTPSTSTQQTPDAGPDMNAPTIRRELENPNPSQPTISPGTDDSMRAPGAPKSIKVPTSLPGQDIVIHLPRAVYSTVTRADGNQVITIKRPAGSSTRIELPTEIPAGTKWRQAGKAGVSLVDGFGRPVSVLTTGFRSSKDFSLGSSGRTLVADFKNRQIPSVGEIVSSLKHPASANGCTTAPGPTGSFAHNCVVVKGNGSTVESAASNYYYGQPISANVCGRHHDFMWTDKASGQVQRRVISPEGCINGAAVFATGDYVTLPGTPIEAKSGTAFCTRAKNSQTGGEWSPWACIDIH